MLEQAVLTAFLSDDLQNIQTFSEQTMDCDFLKNVVTSQWVWLIEYQGNLFCYYKTKSRNDKEINLIQ